MNDFGLNLIEKQVFVARQPIFNNKKEVFAYKLLFRSSFENYFSFEVDGDVASSKVLSNTLHLLGIEKLASGKPVFITLTETLLENKVFTLFPNDKIIIDIPNTLKLSDKIIKDCLALKKLNYVFCTDNRLFLEQKKEAECICDIVKIDIKKYVYDYSKEFISSHKSKKIKFLAEKVETYQEFEKACKIGFDYFHGYFFSKPQILTTKDIAPFKINQIHLVNELYKNDPDFNKIEKIISADVSLTYKLLRLLNSSAFGLKSEIKSIMHALTLLGINELRKWITLIAMTGLGSDKPEALVVSSITRGFFMKGFAKITNNLSDIDEFFLYGVFSLIDSILDRKMEDIVNELPLIDDVKKALTGNINKYYNAGKLFVTFEKGEWGDFIAICRDLKVDEGELAALYTNSVEEAYNLFKICK